MTTSEVIAIIVAILGSGGLWTFVQSLLNKKSKLTERVECIERDCNRTQLLLLIHDYPKSHEEILKVAQEYFVKLNGNWYMDALFQQWLKKEKIEKPQWYKGE